MSNSNKTDWTLADLQDHLKMAIDLEFWTIPFYRVAYHAISDATAQTAIDNVSQQEMYHCQCAWNIAQAFGTDYDFKDRTFAYEGTTIPHLNFALEDPNPATTKVTIGGTEYDFTNYSATLNPSSFADRISAMCLVEYPDWDKPSTQELKPSISEYPSIGHFYAAIQSLMTTDAEFSDGTKVSSHLTGGGATQTGLFTGLASSQISEKITDSGDTGIGQVNDLIMAIVEEGEGTSSSSTGVPDKYQFNGDAEAHFNAFLGVYSQGLTQKSLSSAGVTQIMDGLTAFLPAVQTMFESGGTNTSDFYTAMYAFDGVISSAFSS